MGAGLGLRARMVSWGTAGQAMMDSDVADEAYSALQVHSTRQKDLRFA